MSDKVIISKSKLDTLADTIKSKSGVTDNLTLDELAQKVNNIETGGGGDGSDVTTKLSSLTANSGNSYFELPQSITDIRGIEIKYRFTGKPDGESWVCGNWKSNTNSFLLGYYRSMIQFSISTTALKIPFDTDWHIAKIENNRLFIDETQSENEIAWSNLSALGNLNIFRSPHTGDCLYKEISYVKITDVSGKTQTYYPYIIGNSVENSVAFVSEENRVTSNESFTYSLSNDYYESHKLFWVLDTIGFGKTNPKGASIPL